MLSLIPPSTDTYLRVCPPSTVTSLTVPTSYTVTALGPTMARPGSPASRRPPPPVHGPRAGPDDGPPRLDRQPRPPQPDRGALHLDDPLQPFQGLLRRLR